MQVNSIMIFQEGQAIHDGEGIWVWVQTDTCLRQDQGGPQDLLCQQHHRWRLQCEVPRHCWASENQCEDQHKQAWWGRWDKQWSFLKLKLSFFILGRNRNLEPCDPKAWDPPRYCSQLQAGTTDIFFFFEFVCLNALLAVLVKVKLQQRFTPAKYLEKLDICFLFRWKYSGQNSLWQPSSRKLSR